MLLLEISKNEWPQFSENAHLAVFEKSKPTHFDRIDYALLLVEDGKPFGYVTVRELDHESVYWQFGGTFPWARNSILTTKGYDLLVQHQLGKSKRIVTYIENTNLPMLKLAISRQWIVCGVKHYNGTTLVELVKELK